jgi:hypothetical protein
MDDHAAMDVEDTLRGVQPLISARVDNTPVYDSAGRKLGVIYSFHIDRLSGRVEYAVLSFGGLLGLGQSYHPVPFKLLHVNQEKGGYTIRADKEMLKGSPSYRPDSAPQWNADYAARISDYYKAVIGSGER